MKIASKLLLVISIVFVISTEINTQILWNGVGRIATHCPDCDINWTNAGLLPIFFE